MTIIEALCKAQSQMANPKMTGVGQIGQRKYNYATLKDVLDVVLPPLREAGIWLSQSMNRGNLETIVRLGDETALLDSRPVDLSGTPQQQGSAETYAKRYALCTVFCLVGVEDDDGASASEQSTPDERLKASKQRLWKAIQDYAVKHGSTAEAILEGVKKRPEYAETVEFFDSVTYEFEQSNG